MGASPCRILYTSCFGGLSYICTYRAGGVWGGGLAAGRTRRGAGAEPGGARDGVGVAQKGLVPPGGGLRGIPSPPCCIPAGFQDSRVPGEVFWGAGGTWLAGGREGGWQRVGAVVWGLLGLMCGGEVGRWRGGGLHGILWSPPAPGTSQGLVWDGGPSIWGASLGKSSPWLHAHPVRGPISASQAGAALRLPELPPVGLGPRSPFLFSPLSPPAFPLGGRFALCPRGWRCGVCPGVRPSVVIAVSPLPPHPKTAGPSPGHPAGDQ